MARYSAGGRSADTLATIDHCAAELWNPHASISLFVVEIQVVQIPATASNHALIRSSAKGTAGSTVTPDIDNHYARRYAPISLTTLELAAFSAQPTLQGPYMARANTPAAAASGFVWSFHDEPVEVPAGTGLCIVTPVAVILQDSDFTFVWDE
jgi:hypothetical protein